ncbi:hypothetical protein DM558_07720 [Entomomonas moraniae]|uniref:Uncharacterized protein n=1 Tax=Entomomonas moraniae TaxID=2213226 RepID=A0A3S9XDY4_9GAMM|nr:YmfL family putative regulatory protein [Entomomonas moraniae]AZS50673.1 hypothetical protein DM558_07720 [Entomomonas moraniae]
MRAAVQKAIKSYQGGWSAMAAALGMSVDALENRVYEKKGQSLALHEALMIESISETSHITEAMAARHHAVVITLPDVEHENKDLLVIQSQLQKALSGLLSTVANSYEDDGVIDRKEEKQILNEKTEAHKAVEKFVQVALTIFKQ